MHPRTLFFSPSDAAWTTAKSKTIEAKNKLQNSRGGKMLFLCSYAFFIIHFNGIFSSSSERLMTRRFAVGNSCMIQIWIEPFGCEISLSRDFRFCFEMIQISFVSWPEDSTNFRKQTAAIVLRFAPICLPATRSTFRVPCVACWHRKPTIRRELLIIVISFWGARFFLRDLYLKVRFAIKNKSK